MSAYRIAAVEDVMLRRVVADGFELNPVLAWRRKNKKRRMKDRIGENVKGGQGIPEMGGCDAS